MSSRFMRSIPITPDMVFLGVPSGLNRAQDLIRGNHGQCYGTHPNVPVLPNLINPSVGWEFDGTNDYIDCGNDKSLALTKWTYGLWIYRKTDNPAAERLVSKSDSTVSDFFIHIHTDNELYTSFTDTVGGDHSLITVEAIPLGEWAFANVTFDGTYLKIYINGVLKATSSDYSAFIPRTSTRNLWIGRLQNTYRFNGYIALPFVVNKAWSAAQISNFYNATKGMFAPRG